MNKARAFPLFVGMLLLAACTTPTRTPPQPQGVDLTGSWLLTTHSAVGAQDAEMTVQQKGEQITGKLSSSQGTVDYAGTVQGNAVAFSFVFGGAGQSVKLEYSGTVSGDTISGKTVLGPFGEGTFTAKRK